MERVEVFEEHARPGVEVHVSGEWFVGELCGWFRDQGGTRLADVRWSPGDGLPVQRDLVAPDQVRVWAFSYLGHRPSRSLTQP